MRYQIKNNSKTNNMDQKSNNKKYQSSYQSSFRNVKKKVKNAKNRTASSNRWLTRQMNDQYVFMKNKLGYRSRAAFKLLEIQEKFHIIKPNNYILDLGGAPGSWSQIAANIAYQNTNPKTSQRTDSSSNATSNENHNLVVAIDLLPIKSINHVTSLQMDFTDPNIKTILKELGYNNFDVIMSDMAANTMGDKKTDHIRILNLCEQALNFAIKHLNKNGNFIAKLFMGGGASEIIKSTKIHFKQVHHFKPEASRKNSTEFYLVAKGKK